jgi:hypothetical protein
MAPEGMQAVGVGRGDKGFTEPRCHSPRTAIRIEQTLVKMAYLDCIKAIDFCKQTRSD